MLDDDTAALVLSKTALGVTEQEPGGSFTVALASAPTAPVTVTVASPAESGLTIAGTALTFHSGNWADGQTVTVAAADDADADDKVVTLTLTAAGAPEYAALDASEVRVMVADNDAAGIGLSATELELDEGGEVSAAFASRFRRRTQRMTSTRCAFQPGSIPRPGVRPMAAASLAVGASDDALLDVGVRRELAGLIDRLGRPERPGTGHDRDGERLEVAEGTPRRFRESKRADPVSRVDAHLASSA